MSRYLHYLLRNLRKHTKLCRVISRHDGTKCSHCRIVRQVDDFLKRNAGIEDPPRLDKPRTKGLRIVLNGFNDPDDPELCSVCYKPTMHWYQMMDVALCRMCSYKAPASAIPNKEKWFANLEQFQLGRNIRHNTD